MIWSGGKINRKELRIFLYVGDQVSIDFLCFDCSASDYKGLYRNALHYLFHVWGVVRKLDGRRLRVYHEIQFSISVVTAHISRIYLEEVALAMIKLNLRLSFHEVFSHFILTNPLPIRITDSQT